MYNVNLIPQDLSVGGRTNKAAGAIRSLSILIAVLLVVSLLGVVGLFFYFSTTLSSVNNSNNQLKTQISNLEQSEQKFVYAKDRLDKIEKINSLESSVEEISTFNSLYNFLKGQPGMRVSEVSIDPKKLELSVSSESFGSMSNFMNNLDQESEKLTKDFKTITLDSFSYSQSSGYVASLVFGQ